MGIDIVIYRYKIGVFGGGRRSHVNHTLGERVLSSYIIRLPKCKGWPVMLFFLAILLLAGDIELNPGPKQNLGAVSDPSDSSQAILAELKLLGTNASKMERNFNAKLTRMESQLDSINDSTKSLVTDMDQVKKEVGELQKTCLFLSSEIERLDEKLQPQTSPTSVPSSPSPISSLNTPTMMTKIIDLENRSRRNNLIISNLEEKSDESPFEIRQLIESFLANQLKLHDLIVERVHRLGKKRPNFSRPVIIRLLNSADKNKIWSNISNLKNTSIKIREDFALETRRARAALWRYARDNSEPQESFRIRVDRLYLRGLTYSFDYNTNKIIKLTNHPNGLQVINSDSSIILPTPSPSTNTASQQPPLGMN